MPSTYSNNGFELISPGEQENTWGGTTNTNWELVDEAIDGVVTITSTSLAQTLTITDGSSSNGRHKVIQYSGSPAGAVTVTVSPNDAQKVYMVLNNYDQSVTFTQGTGGNVTVAAGKSATIFTDGAGATAKVYEYTGTLQIPTVDITGGTIDSVALTGSTISGCTITNNVTGNLTGNVTGDVTGDLDGNLVATAPTAPTAAAGTSTTQIATTAFVAAELAALDLSSLWPVGSVYINATASTNPATLLGFGTWVAFGAGRVLVGLDSSDTLFDTVEEIGGSKDAVVVAHTHTAAASTDGAHTHTYLGGDGNDQNMGAGTQSYEEVTNKTTSSSGSHTHTVTVDSAGVSGTDANIQPYITVYMWKRTA